MTNDKFRKLLPISGIISALLLAGAIVASGDNPQVSATNHADVIAAYTDHQTGIFISSVVGLLAMFFFSGLLAEVRATLRSGEAGESIYSTLALIGGVVVIGGTAVMALTSAAAASAVEYELGPQGILSTAVIADSAWMPWVAGMAVLQWAVGLGGLRTATLPKGICWVSIVLGVLCLTGIGGIAVFFIAPLWMLALSILLLRAQRSPAPTTAAIPTPA